MSEPSLDADNGHQMMTIALISAAFLALLFWMGVPHAVRIFVTGFVLAGMASLFVIEGKLDCRPAPFYRELFFPLALGSLLMVIGAVIGARTP